MTRRESNPGEIRLRLSGPSAVHDATRAAQAFAISADLDHIDRSHLCIIVEELVTNLYDHGELEDDDVVELGLSSTAQGVSLILIDPGKQFDPRFAAIDAPVPDRGGGAGLKLVRSWARLIEYHVADGRNRLAMVIPRHASSKLT